MRLLISIFVMLCTSVLAMATNFSSGGIVYTILSPSEVAVSGYSSSTDMSGTLVLPSTVRYSGYTYSVTVIGKTAFKGCSELTKLSIPNSVTEIGYAAFSGCSGLTELSIPNSVKYIKGEAFSKCTGLATLTIGISVSEIGYYAFYGCTRLTELSIPNSVKSIGSNAFQECIGLEQVEIGNSVKSIGSKAFDMCSSLTELTIPNSVTTIESEAFRYCYRLRGVKFDDGDTEIRIGLYIFNQAPIETLYLGRNINTELLNNRVPFGEIQSTLKTLNIGDSVTSICSRAFEGCSELSSLRIGNSVTSIERKAFYMCKGLTEVAIPNSVTSIGSEAFHLCSKLSVISIGNSVDTIEVNAFNYCPLTEIVCLAVSPPLLGYYPANNLTYDSFDNNTYENAFLTIPAGTLSDYKSSPGWEKFIHITEKTSTVLIDYLTPNFDNLELLPGESKKIEITISPLDATNQTLGWTSSNEEVATVDHTGFVTAVAQGSTVITASSTDGSGKSATCAVTVVPTPAESVTLDKTSASLKVGETVTLSATVLPEDATDKTVAWSSNNPEIATVDEQGLVTAIKEGDAEITATSVSNPELAATCAVKVSPVLVEELTLEPEDWEGETGTKFTITATILPENATNKNLMWVSSDPEIAEVDYYGNVEILKAGICTITATTLDGSNLSADCRIVALWSGIGNIFADDNGVYDVFSIGGQLIKKSCGRENLEKLSPGAYIIRSGNEVVKVIVR